MFEKRLPPCEAVRTLRIGAARSVHVGGVAGVQFAQQVSHVSLGILDADGIDANSSNVACELCQAVAVVILTGARFVLRPPSVKVDVRGGIGHHIADWHRKFAIDPIGGGVPLRELRPG